MAALSRFINAPASRRSFSSYFSSKAGGGRYFNSAKPGKPGVVAANAAPKPDTAAAAEAQPDGSVQSSPSSPLAEPQAAPSTPTATAAAVESPSPLTTSSHMPPLAVSAKDFKMHQFFALHRPLLLIGQPAALFRGVAHGQPLLTRGAPAPQPGLGSGLGLGLGLDAPLDPLVDADAEAARQLTRALTVARAEAALSWERTLKHLGLDVAQDADRVGLPAQFAREWAEVLLDSTKRKRRKKMKKHK